MKRKRCAKCEKIKSKKCFYNNGKSNRSWCKDCLTGYQRDRWKARKKKALIILGGKCMDCGYDKNLSAIDFHHIEPSQKEFLLSKIAGYSWDRFIKELTKCIPLCKNCHAERHNPMMATELIDESNATRKLDKSTYSTIVDVGQCICGKSVYGTKYCSTTCSAKDHRKVERPDKFLLSHLLASNSWTAVGKMYGVSDNSVRKWAKSYGL